MPAFVYIHARSAGVYTVGHYDPNNNQWEPESDHRTDAQAAARTHYMNGGNPGFDQLVAALYDVRHFIDADPLCNPELKAHYVTLINTALAKAGVAP